MNFATETGVDEYKRPTLDSRDHPDPPSPRALSPYPTLGIPRLIDLCLALSHLWHLLMVDDLDLLMTKSHFPIKHFCQYVGRVHRHGPDIMWSSRFSKCRRTWSIPSTPGSRPFSKSGCSDIPTLSPSLKQDKIPEIKCSRVVAKTPFVADMPQLTYKIFPEM